MNEQRLCLIDKKSSLDFFDLQKIFKYDERFLKYKRKLERLTKLFHKMMEFQYEDKESEITKAIQPELIDSLDLCDNEEELNDYYEFFQLYFGRDLQKMNSHNAKGMGAHKMWDFKQG